MRKVWLPLITKLDSSVERGGGDGVKSTNIYYELTGVYLFPCNIHKRKKSYGPLNPLKLGTHKSIAELGS
jgi:hypothetical protein